MKYIFVIVALNLVYVSLARSIAEEDSVVSIYTTQSTTAGTAPTFDVYHQIANNIAERITSPIYRLFGLGKNDTFTGTKRPFSFDKIELLDEGPEDVTKTPLGPVDNDISIDRDIEPLSVEALTKPDKKPEKITLFSSYLPAKLEANDTMNEVSDDDDDDDDLFEFDDEKPREGGIVYFLELIASFFQLAWGALMAFFKPSTSS